MPFNSTLLKKSAKLLQNCRHDAMDRILVNVLYAAINNYDSTSIRRPFDCLSKVIKVTVT